MQQALEDGHGERRTFLRIRAGAEFVDEDEVICARLVEDGNDMRHVRGKRRKALLDALLVADVGKDIVVKRNRRALLDRQKAAALRHEHEEAERLHADGLAARIRSRDEQHGKARAELDVNRHDLFSWDERMACGKQMRLASCGQLWLRGFHTEREARFCKREIDLREDVGIRCERVLLLLHLMRQALEDARDLTLLGDRELLDVVAGLDDRHRFDEERGARRALIVDDAGEKAAVFGLDRQDVALVADGDERVLEMFLMLGRMEDRVDAFFDMRFGSGALAADAAEFDARIITQFAVLVHGEIKAALELPEEFERMRGVFEHRRVGFERLEKFFDIARRIEEAADVHEFVECQRGAELDFLQHRTQVADAAERRRGKTCDADGFGGFGKTRSDILAVARRLDGAGALLAEAAARAICKQRTDAVIF